MIELDRRRAITLRMVSDDRPKGSREAALTFIRKVARRTDLTDFLDNAVEPDVAHVEGLLGL